MMRRVAGNPVVCPLLVIAALLGSSHSSSSVHAQESLTAGTGTPYLVFSPYLGGETSDTRDDTYSMVLDPKGLIVATGRTQSAGFPMTGPGVPAIYDSAPYLKAGTPPNESGDEPCLVNINPSLKGKASLVYSTFPGGNESDCTYGLAIDPASNVILTGLTFSADFPVKYPVQTWPGNTGYQNAFVTKFPSLPFLNVTKSGSGSGAVTSSPSGIDCGSICSAGFEKGTKVILTPIPEKGSVFTGWTGACTANGTCSATVSTVIGVGVVFEKGSRSYALSSSEKSLTYKGGEIAIWVTAKDYTYCPAPGIINHAGLDHLCRHALHRKRGLSQALHSRV